MNNKVSKVENQITSVLPKEKYELAKALVARGASDAEFELLVHMANKYNLDPLARQIWCIKRNPNDPALIMTSRDGYLTIAHQSGQFDGMESSVERDEKGKPIKATCVVWRKDMEHPFKSEVYFNEYNQGNFVWQKYPSAMLIKVAEVFALKRAFSVSGMVAEEEIHVDSVEAPSNEDRIPSKEVLVQEVGFSTKEEPVSLKMVREELLNISEGEKDHAKTLMEKLEAKYGSSKRWDQEVISSIYRKLKERN